MKKPIGRMKSFFGHHFQQGSAFIEITILLVAILPCIIIGLSLAGASGAKVLMQKFVYEGLICMAEGQPTAKCKRIVEKKLKQAIPFGQMNRLILLQNGAVLRGELDWQWNTKWKIKISAFIPASPQS